jgi:hypothetical protein
MSNFQSYSNSPAAEETSITVDPAGITLRPSQGVHRVNISGDEALASQVQHTTVNSNELSSFGQDDWRSTARNLKGATSTITRDCVVKIGAMETTIENFVGVGVLREVAPNQFEMATTSGVTQENAQESIADPDAALMPDEVATSINAALEPFDDSTVHRTASLSISAIAGGQSLEEAITIAAHSSGVDPHEAKQRIEFAASAVQAQTNVYLDRAGITGGDLQLFYEFCREPSNKSALITALQGQVHGQHMNEWKPLIDRYYSAVPPTAHALKAAGYEVIGNDSVKINGTVMPIKSAAKAGLI